MIWNYLCRRLRSESLILTFEHVPDNFFLIWCVTIVLYLSLSENEASRELFRVVKDQARFPTLRLQPSSDLLPGSFKEMLEQMLEFQQVGVLQHKAKIKQSSHQAAAFESLIYPDKRKQNPLPFRGRKLLYSFLCCL